MTNKLRRLLSGGLVMAPGAYDALSARLAEQAGFQAVYMSGFGVSAGRLGRPDLGLITLTEMADTLANMSKSVGVPVIADADTGYGGSLNVIRTVNLYEAAGASAIQIEDQQWPKRCGHIQGKTLIPKEEMVAKIRAALEARTKDTLIVARTDAIAVEGFDAALDRAESYLRAGADVLFVEAPENMDQLVDIPRRLPAVHLINMAETGKGFNLTADQLEAMGYRLAIYPGTAFLAAIRAMSEALSQLLAERSAAGLASRFVPAKEFLDLIGMFDFLGKDRHYAEEARKHI